MEQLVVYATIAHTLLHCWVNSTREHKEKARDASWGRTARTYRWAIVVVVGCRQAADSSRLSWRHISPPNTLAPLSLSFCLNLPRERLLEFETDKQAITPALPVVTPCSQLDSNSWTIAFPARPLVSSF
jgi:hypothetical protein